jgi:hypothetical protein
LIGEKSDLQTILVAMFANLFVERRVDGDNCVSGFFLHVGKYLFAGVNGVGRDWPACE